MDENLARKVLVYRWPIFWIMALAYIFVYFHRLCPAVVALDLQEALNTSGGFMGILASAYFYPYALMQFPAGLLSDSLGPRIAVSVSLIIAGIGSVLFGLAPTVELAVAARVMVGLGVSLVFIPFMKLLSQWFRVREFATMVGLASAMGGVGALTAATPLALLTGYVGWRASFELIGVGTLIVAACVWAIVRNRPQDRGWPSIEQIDRMGPINVPAPARIPLWEGAGRVVREKYFWPVAMWFFFMMAVFFSFGGLWAGPYLMHVYGMTRAQAGGILDMIAVGMIVGGPLMSFMSDRALRSRKKVLVLSSGIVVLLMLFVNVFPSGLSRAGLYAFMLAFSVSSSAIVVMGFTTTKELFPVEMAGTSVGTVNLFPFLGGALAQPILGWILDAYPRNSAGDYSLEGYQAMLLALLALATAAWICTLFMKETFPVHR